MFKRIREALSLLREIDDRTMQIQSATRRVERVQQEEQNARKLEKLTEPPRDLWVVMGQTLEGRREMYFSGIWSAEGPAKKQAEQMPNDIRVDAILVARVRPDGTVPPVDDPERVQWYTRKNPTQWGWSRGVPAWMKARG